MAFSNRRLLRFDPARGQVAFLCKDYRTGKRRTLTLGAAEFIRRFLLHVLPGGFMRIRHYGFLANCVRRKKLPLCRRLLGQPADGPKDRSSPAEQQPQQCPACGKGVLCAIATLPDRSARCAGKRSLQELREACARSRAGAPWAPFKTALAGTGNRSPALFPAPSALPRSDPAASRPPLALIQSP